MTWNELVTEASHGCRFADTLDQLKDMVYSRSAPGFEMGKQVRSSLVSPEQVRNRGREVRAAFIQSLGGLNFPPCSLDPQVSGTVDLEDLRIEKVIFQSRPSIFVTTNLYKPLQYVDSPDRFPAILMLCGHQLLGKAADEYQLVAQILARHGFLVLIVDPVGQGERLSYLDPRTSEPLVGGNTLEHDHEGFQSAALGYSLARYMLYDNIRALDYLISRPDVDGSRIGLTGNSGGGAQVAMMMMTEDRIAAAAPATFLMNRWEYQKTGQAQDREQHWPGLTARGLDHEDVLITFAPRPTLLVTARDDFFPLEATLETYRNTKRIYGILGRPENLEIFTENVEHSYTPTMAIRVGQFFAQVLYSPEERPPVLPGLARALAPEVLWCAPRGQVVLGLPQARTLHHELLQSLETIRSQRPSDAKDILTSWVYQNRKPGDLFLKRGFSSGLDLLGGIRVHVESWTWYSQTDMRGFGILFQKPDQENQGIVLAYWPQGTQALALEEHQSWIRIQILNRKSVFVVDLSGVGALAQRPLVWWTKDDDLYGPLYKLNDDLLWLGDSLALLRIYEVLRSFEVASILSPGLTQSLYTEEYFSVYAEFALYIADNPGEIETKNPFESYEAWVRTLLYPTTLGPAVQIPGILTLTDLPEIRKERRKQ